MGSDRWGQTRLIFARCREGKKQDLAPIGMAPVKGTEGILFIPSVPFTFCFRPLFFDPELPSLPLMQSAGDLTESGPFPPQVRGPIGQGQAFRFQNEYPYVKPDPGAHLTDRRRPDVRR